MKKKIGLLIVVTLIISSLFHTTKIQIDNDVKLDSNNLTNEQKALQEVAYAYYRQSNQLQYDSNRKSFNYAPEEATGQNSIYSVCSSFTYLVYDQAFVIKLPTVTNTLNAYAYQNKEQDDIILSLYGDELKNQVSTASQRAEFARKLLEEYNLSVGDVITWSTGYEGHAMMVYEITYNTDGNPIDATIIHSTSNFEKDTNKLKKGLSYSNTLNSETGIYEGTIKMMDLTRTVYSARNMTYFAIIRPLLTDENNEYTGEYYASSCKSNGGSGVAGYNCTSSLENYTMTPATQSRLKYSGIGIEKTVDKFNKSNVYPGDTLTYTISITNNSDSAYQNLPVTENIPEYTTLSNAGGGTVNNNVITWNINVPAGTTQTISYSVTVDKDSNVIGKTITATGKVDNIATSTVTNYVFNHLTDEQKTQIIDAYNQLSSSYTGKELINEVYKKALKMDLNLEALELTDLVQTTVNQSSSPVLLNEEIEFRNMLLDNYYGAIYTSTSGTTILLKSWESSPTAERSNRNDTIYDEHFQTGDILIYQNKQSQSGNMIAEDGEYAFIYLDDAFYGINTNGNNKYGLEPYSTNGNNNLQTILAKDYYVILRPAKIIPYNELGVPSAIVTVPPTSANSLSIFMYVGLSIIIIVAIVIGFIVYNKKKSIL